MEAAGAAGVAERTKSDDLCASRGLTRPWMQQWTRLTTHRGLWPFPADIPPIVVRPVSTEAAKPHGTPENLCVTCLSSWLGPGLTLLLSAPPSFQVREINVSQRLDPTIDIRKKVPR